MKSVMLRATMILLDSGKCGKLGRKWKWKWKWKCKWN